MIGFVVLAVLVVWLIVSALTAMGCAVLARGGLHEDLLRGFLTDRS
jgi:hypothetical protein